MIDDYRNDAYTGWVRVGDLQFDESYQRTGQLNHARINDIARNYDAAAIGVILVSEREDGSLYVIDGMHRVLATIKRFGADHRMHATLVCHLTVAEEARAFWMQTKRTAVSKIQQFNARLAAGDAVAVNLLAMLDGAGISAPKRHGSPEYFRAIAMLERLAKQHGDEIVSRALCVASDGCRARNEAPTGWLIAAIVEMLLRFDVDDKRLTEAVAALDMATFKRDVTSANSLYGNLAYGAGAVLHREYNRGRRNRLPDFATTPRRKRGH